MTAERGGVVDLHVLEPGDRAEDRSRARPVEVLLRVARVIVEGHPALDRRHERHAVQVTRDERGHVLVGKRDVVLLLDHVVVVLVAGRTPHEHLLRPIGGEVTEAARRVAARGFTRPVHVVDDPAAVRRTTDRVEVEPHRLQHRGDRRHEVGGAQDVAAQIEEQVLGLGIVGRPILERLGPVLELQVGQEPDLAEVLAEGKGHRTLTSPDR